VFSLETFSITFVCTGNRSRSALAEAFMRRLTSGLPVSVDSYGTLPAEDLPALPEAAAIAEECGVSIADHRSRALDNAALGDVDLLLGFEPAHVHRAVVDVGAPRDRSFTLRELVSLLDDQPVAPAGSLVDPARARVATAAERASQLPQRNLTAMRDPFGQAWKVHRQSAVEVRALTIALTRALFGTVDASALPPVPEKLARVRKPLWR
jgi:protein-tyrosine-phosphatase